MAPPLYRIETLEEEREHEDNDDLSIYDPKHARAYGSMLEQAKVDQRRRQRAEQSERDGLTPPHPRLYPGLPMRRGGGQFSIPALRPLPEGTRYASGYEPRSELEKEIGECEQNASYCAYEWGARRRNPSHETPPPPPPLHVPPPPPTHLRTSPCACFSTRHAMPLSLSSPPPLPPSPSPSLFLSQFLSFSDDFIHP
jgi:hypothetical protein